MRNEYAPQIENNESETCKGCGDNLVVGNSFMEHLNNNDRYHIGCGNEAGKQNPATKLLLRPRSWPPQRFQGDRI